MTRRPGEGRDWCHLVRQPNAGVSGPGIGRGRCAYIEFPRNFLGISSQNVGNGLTHLLRWRAIRATLGSPHGFDQIQL